MVRVIEAPAGCLIYFMLSIVINLFILILRISAHEVQNNNTLVITTYHPNASAIVNINATTRSVIESGK